MSTSSRTVTESIKAFSQILPAFQLDAEMQLVVQTLEMKRQGHSLTFAEAANRATHVQSIPSELEALFHADEAIWEISTILFDGDRINGPGDSCLSSSEKTTMTHIPCRLEKGTVFAIPNSLTDVALAKAVIFASLYFENAMFVLPAEISDSFISYSGSSWPGFRKPWGSIQTIIEFNKRFESLVRCGKCIFLPVSNTFSNTSLSSHEVIQYYAPLHEKSTHIHNLPLNQHGFPQLAAGGSHAKQAIVDMVLPYFRGVEYSELARLAQNETDAFIKFNYFLSKRLGGLDQAENSNQIRDIMDEIEYETANLRLEAERVARLKSLQGAQLMFFTLSVVTAAFVEEAALKSVAGILGSVSMLELVKEHYNYRRERLNMEKSDCYLPFLIREMKK